MSSDDPILVERSEGVVTLTLNRPDRKNAIEMATWGDLLQCLDEVRRRPEDRALVLTGAGDAFCSGAGFGLDEVDGYREVSMLDLMRQVGEVALALHHLPKPTIARVNGVAVGAGCNLALGCDLVVAADTAVFCEIFMRMGLAVDFGGTWLLPRIVGLHRAKELAFLGDKVSAVEAAAIGLVNRVVPLGELDTVVDDLARRLAAGPPLALSLTKRMLNDSFGRTMAEALEQEAVSQSVTFPSADVAEGIAAFQDRRPPKFSGR